MKNMPKSVDRSIERRGLLGLLVSAIIGHDRRPVCPGGPSLRGRSTNLPTWLLHGVVILALSLLPACECGWCREGFLCHQMVVTVHEGVTRAQVDCMNAELDARVINTTGTLYVIGLPEDVDACEAMDFYDDRPEVRSALPDFEVHPR